jgi:beta-galactosidase
MIQTNSRPFVALFVLVLTTAAPLRAERVTLNFNPDWRFIQEDPSGAHEPGFNDAKWKAVSAPHTFNDVDTFDDWSVPGHRGEQNQWGGRTWYRKTFAAPDAWKGKRLYIEFEGVRQIAEVYLNGQRLGVNKTGFIPFGFDLTPHLKVGGRNVLAVMVDNRFQIDATPPTTQEAKVGSRDARPATTQATTRGGGPSTLNFAPPAGGALAHNIAELAKRIPDNVEDLQGDQIPWNNPHWHPAHGGIYRNVTLHVVDPLHISLPLFSNFGTEGPYVYATDITDKSAKIGIEVPFQNGRADAVDAEVLAEIKDRDGKTVFSATGKPATTAPGGTTKVVILGTLENPQLWEPAYPYLYRVVCTLRAGGQTIDTAEVPLGIRTFKFDNKTGFFVNGRPEKLRGWGQKTINEWPGIGAAQPDWLQFFTLDLMKQAGANFVRWGHVTGAPSQIKAADALGIVTLQPGLDGEGDTTKAAWRVRADAFRDLIIYYRNHPSIAIWEGGNQKVSREHAQELRGFMDKYDPHGGRAYAHRRSDKVVGEFMDVCIGTEGGWELKEMGVVEGEYNREESPRRVWDDKSPPNFGYPEAKGMTYQLTSEQFAVNQVTHWVKKCLQPGHSGGANWIFSDSTSGGRVPAEVCRTSGEVDGVRLPKEAYWVCRVMFDPAPQAHIIGHWSYPPDTTKTVYVVADGEEVELSVNGKQVGRAKPQQQFLFEFPDVKFEPGEIKAVAYAAGHPAAEQTKRTAGKPAALRMTTITGPGGLRATGSDYVLIDVEAVDDQGLRCPTFEQRTVFDISGPGVWRGGYNSGKIKSVNNDYLNLEAGINRVAVRSTRQPGTIKVTARSGGLTQAAIEIPSQPVEIDNAMAKAMPPTPKVELPAQRPTPPQQGAGEAMAKGASLKGRFVNNFNYTGPTSGASVQSDAQDGKKVYADADVKFEALPAELRGADWTQLPNADARYSAEDLIELQVKSGSRVYVAHDARLAPPAWIAAKFKPSNVKLTIGGQPMRVYERQVERDESLTLSSNTGDAKASANMYVVFVSGK